MFVRCAHSIEVHPFCFRCHRVNKSDEPIKYKFMAPHFRVQVTQSVTGGLAQLLTDEQFKKVDCSQVGSCFKS